MTYYSSEPMNSNRSIIIQKRVFLCLLMAAVMVMSAFGQGTPFTLTGLVTDTNDEPLVGVSVRIKGTQTGTVTDLDGKFAIQVSSN
jgi:hypothetical protein